MSTEQPSVAQAAPIEQTIAQTPPPAPAPPRTSGLPVSTLVLGAILIAVLAFGIGYFVGRHNARPLYRMPGRMQGGGFVNPGNGMPGGMMPGGGGYGGTSSGSASGGMMPGLGSGMMTARGVTVGTVTRVDGDTIYVQTLGGDTVKVVTDRGTSIQVMRDGSLSDLPADALVVVAGTPGADGSIAAANVFAGVLPWLSAGAPAPASSGGSG